MQHRDTFASYHPLVNFVYFAWMFLFAMFFMHPVSLIISVLSALLYAFYLNGAQTTYFSLRYLLPMVLMAIIINPAFHHEGATILCYLPSGNPFTLESVAYGVASAIMLVAVIVWFRCYTEIMTSDKFVYLFGRIIPALSLVLSMALRFIPKFKEQSQVVAQAQKCIGRDVATGSLWERIRTAITIFSIMVTWSLENAIETADSMKSRGYGLSGRTAFSIYRWEERDRWMMLWLCTAGVYILMGWLCGGFAWRYYPTMQGVEQTPLAWSFQLVYLCLACTPLCLDQVADQSWKHTQQKGASI